MKKFLLIINPAAGKGAAARKIPEIQRMLAAEHVQATVETTTGPWQAATLARQAAGEGYDAVIAAGGDGTVNEVINGLMEARALGQAMPAFGVLPVGRGNDFAYGVGLPTDWLTAFQSMLHGEAQAVDLGRAEIHGAAGGSQPITRYFGNGIGIGFDTLVNIEAGKIAVGGFVGYGIAALRTLLLRFHTPLLRIETPERRMEQPCIMVSVMNGRRMGGGFLMAPQASSDDGLLDICLAGKANRLTILGMLPRFMRGSQAGHPAVQFIQTRQITITAPAGELPVHADGETLTETAQQVTVTLVPAALRVLRTAVG